MINNLLGLDRSLFFFINHLPHNFIFDTFFGFFTFIGYIGAVWILLGINLYFRRKKDKKILLPILLAGFLSTFIELVVKNYIARLRPQYTIPGTIVPYDFYKNYSFPSGHATMSFAGFYVLAKLDKKNRYLYLLLALIISFSRIYLGKHYPSDVVAGAIIGLGIGWSANKIKVKI